MSAKIYISAGIDEHISRQHPEWLRREKYGEDQDATGFRRLCFNSEYLDILKEQTREVVERYKPDGVFFDIISTWPCYCDNCLAEMKRRGLDQKDEKSVKVVLRPDGKELPFIYESGTVNFSLKDFNCYATIEFIY